MLLEEKIAWVTGASRGIGQAAAVALAAEGAHVVISARKMENLSETSERIKSLGMNPPLLLAYDVSNRGETKEALSSVQKAYKRLDVLVNNAGMLEKAMLGMITEESLHRMFAVNLYSVIFHMQYASRLMMRQKSGSMINISSILGRFGSPGYVAYSASKAALIGASKSAAKELAPSNIRVNVVAPGFIDTNLIRQFPAKTIDEQIKSIRMGRIGDPTDVASMIAFLASDRSAYVTGQVIGVDGGMIV
ncbi:SDR family NAD(P)-dependent oxidoreductase [Marinicrinis lubricantis]|uniref:SDR family NAD(P)-dependent oxidoreductase n=1 Tax=Marinicrinis lubricantis TaxID=2086470 RepID=A0ABW1IQU1_9BACL